MIKVSLNCGTMTMHFPFHKHVYGNCTIIKFIQKGFRNRSYSLLLKPFCMNLYDLLLKPFNMTTSEAFFFFFFFFYKFGM